MSAECDSATSMTRLAAKMDTKSRKPQFRQVPDILQRNGRNTVKFARIKSYGTGIALFDHSYKDPKMTGAQNW